MPLARQRSAHIHLDLPVAPAQLSLAELRHWHRQGQIAYRQQKSQSGHYSWLELKRELAWRLLAQCNFCVHDCQVNRREEQTGYCQLGSESPISGSYLHWGEEGPIRPTWALFFSGCTMHCLYCHNWRETFEFSAAQALQIPVLVQTLQQHRGQYRSISLIGGTPEPHLHRILDLVLALPKTIDVPLVFNNNATLSTEGLDLMEGIVDIYLPDWKHGNDRCAWKLTKIAHYLQAVRSNLQGYLDQKAAILVRHLVLPGHLHCCTRPILESLAAEFPQLSVNVMFQYRPMYRAETDPLLQRKLNTDEEITVQKWIAELKLNTLPETTV